MAVGDPDQCLVAGTLVTMADGSTRPIEDDPGRRRGAVRHCGSGRVRGSSRRSRSTVRPGAWASSIMTAPGRSHRSRRRSTSLRASPARCRTNSTRECVGQDPNGDQRVISTLCGAEEGGLPLHSSASRDVTPKRRATATALGLSPRRREAGGVDLRNAISGLGRRDRDQRSFAEWALGVPARSLRPCFRPQRRCSPADDRIDLHSALTLSGPGWRCRLPRAGSISSSSVERVDLDAPVYDLDSSDAQLRRQRPRHTQLDLRFQRRRYPQHPRVRARLPGHARDPARAELPLDQPILHAANAVIEHNRERKEKELWSDLGEGEPVRVVEVEDEHAEARYVAAEIARARRRRATASARSRSSTARTRRAACWRTSSSGRASPTR